MPRQISNSFTEYEMTQEEMYVATRFTDLQIMLLQSLLSQSAQKRLKIKIDTNNLQASLQEEAAIAGEISTYEYLLSLYTDIPNPATKTP